MIGFDTIGSDPVGNQHRLIAATTLGLVSAWLAGRILGDGNLWTGLLFYIPTWVPITACLITSLYFRQARRSIAAISGIVALALLGHWLATEMTWTRPTANSELHSSVKSGFDHRYQLVHWNVFRNYLPWKSKIERLRSIEADIFVLNEVPRQISRGNWALKLGPHMDYALGQLMVVACRGRVLCLLYTSPSPRDS